MTLLAGTFDSEVNSEARCTNLRTQVAANQAANCAATSEDGHEQRGGKVAEAQQLQPQREKDHRVPWGAAHNALHSSHTVET